MTEDMPFDTEEEIVEYVHSDGSESENEIGKSTSGKVCIFNSMVFEILIHHRLKQKFILLIKKIKNTGNSTDEGVINLIHRQKRLEGYEIEKYLNNENTEFYDSNEVYDNSSLDSYVSESLTVIRPQLKPFFSNLTVNSSNSIRTESDTHKIKDIKEKYNLNGKLRRSNSIDLNKIMRGNAEKLRPTLSCNDNLPSKCITSGRPDSDGWNNFDISNEEIYLKKSGTYEKEINLPTSTISEIVDMINSILHGKEITETFILIDMNNYTETMLSLLKKKFNCVLICKSYLAVSIFMQNMLDSIDKFCAINAHRPVILQILIYGDDAFVSWILRSYVLQSQNRKSQNDWTNFLRFLFIPASANSDFATYLSSIDAKYNFNFNDDMWKSTFLDNKLLLNVDGSSNCPLMNKKSLNCKSLDLISSRIESYIKTARSTCYLQIAEVMFNDFNSNHVFVPFINRVNIGNNTSSDCRNSANGNSQVSSKIKQFPKKKLSNNVCSKRNSTGAKDLKCLNVQNIYPPLRDSNFLSPSDAPSWQCNDTSTTSDQYPSTSFISSNSNTHIDLQIDYWMSMLTSLPRPSSFEIKQYRRDSQTQSKNKISLKSCIYASVKRLPENSILPNLNIISVNCLFLKRKKNNIINRISKKSISKDGRMREQSIVHCQNGVSRVICSSKYPNQYITLDVDGHEWKALSFFQVAAQWKGHTKYFPITMFGYSS
ncbi:hypothetical protein A3Q56_00383 [Intoshia linei]|uniref:Phosphofurin acidic cluster sorting protein 1/2 C-terminal domain-containing protein n=1 Tax=Intoshia linei TaxID=1819745 RepID=A0A177BCA8_9BILA|nr:hypothetical protein A3Q56_00383 [Intoshia linei]